MCHYRWHTVFRRASHTTVPRYSLAEDFRSLMGEGESVERAGSGEGDQSMGDSVPQVPPPASVSAAQRERAYVHEVYNVIAQNFSHTRSRPWPLVGAFAESVPEGHVLLDCGCGNGKNMVHKGLNVGVDMCYDLLRQASERYNGFKAEAPFCHTVPTWTQADSLSLPLRPSSVDHCMSIAVVHHMASHTRRVEALCEMYRVLAPGGMLLVSVWANIDKLRKKFHPLSEREGEQDVSREASPYGLDVYAPWSLQHNWVESETEVKSRLSQPVRVTMDIPTNQCTGKTKKQRYKERQRERQRLAKERADARRAAAKAQASDTPSATESEGAESSCTSAQVSSPAAKRERKVEGPGREGEGFVWNGRPRRVETETPEEKREREKEEQRARQRILTVDRFYHLFDAGELARCLSAAGFTVSPTLKGRLLDMCPKVLGQESGEPVPVVESDPPGSDYPGCEVFDKDNWFVLAQKPLK
ncbi:hypothetical protein KIPB_004607 [Kipferlia bialata]|uniref:Methyltransferase type 11 domain-containing protein n=1 Tax=Kipferlia bialata TaxID=797122 RepID=A0A9K3CU13_9EUKA|nr:hypothetical protein KIPB_004607 [Kipferlia bialata]|eukprot:g4607.t1